MEPILDDVRLVLAVVGDDDGVLDHEVELLDAALDEGVLVHRLLVLGVLAHRADFLRLVDALGDLLATHGAELLQLLFQRSEAVDREVCLLLSHAATPLRAVYAEPPRNKTPRRR